MEGAFFITQALRFGRWSTLEKWIADVSLGTRADCVVVLDIAQGVEAATVQARIHTNVLSSVASSVVVTI